MGRRLRRSVLPPGRSGVDRVRDLPCLLERKQRPGLWHGRLSGGLRRRTTAPARSRSRARLPASRLEARRRSEASSSPTLPRPAPVSAPRRAGAIRPMDCFSGTSMASPHVAGAVALIWSASPELRGDVARTRRCSTQTAVDVSNTTCGGTAENNNVWGEGKLDVLAAVTAAPRGETGTLTGGVVSGAGGNPPIAGAEIRVAGPANRSVATDPDGLYSMELPVGNYTVTVTAHGYVTSVRRRRHHRGPDHERGLHPAARPRARAQPDHALRPERERNGRTGRDASSSTNGSRTRVSISRTRSPLSSRRARRASRSPSRARPMQTFPRAVWEPTRLASPAPRRARSRAERSSSSD